MSAQHTPSAQWRATGAPDPHGKHYDCERAALAMGTLTDDELANGVFLHGDGTHGRAPIAEVAAGRAFWPIAWLKAAKDRIRWLSRSLERERATNIELIAALRPFAHWASGFGPYGRDDSWVIATTPSGKTLTMGDVRRAHTALAKTTGSAA